MTRPAHQLTPEERLRVVHDIFVRRSLSDMEGQFARMRRGHRTGRQAACMLVIGKPGVGKSEQLRRYAEANPPCTEMSAEDVAVTVQPVVYAELDPDTTVIRAAEKILQSIMGPNAPGGSRARDTVLPTQLAIRRTELLIIDEFQHVAEQGADKTRSRTADWIKSLAKTLRLPIVMAGIPSIEPIVMGNSQLRSITPYRIEIGDYDQTTQAGLDQFRRLLSKIDDQLPFAKPSLLSQDDRSIRLMAASGGNLRSLAHVLAEAADVAIERDAPRIMDEDFHVACERIETNLGCQFNPFE